MPLAAMESSTRVVIHTISPAIRWELLAIAFIPAANRGAALELDRAHLTFCRCLDDPGGSCSAWLEAVLEAAGSGATRGARQTRARELAMSYIRVLRCQRRPGSLLLTRQDTGR